MPSDQNRESHADSNFMELEAEASTEANSIVNFGE
jgi:hypothetical protein